MGLHNRQVREAGSSSSSSHVEQLNRDVQQGEMSPDLAEAPGSEKPRPLRFLVSAGGGNAARCSNGAASRPLT